MRMYLLQLFSVFLGMKTILGVQKQPDMNNDTVVRDKIMVDILVDLFNSINVQFKIKNQEFNKISVDNLNLTPGLKEEFTALMNKSETIHKLILSKINTIDFNSVSYTDDSITELNNDLKDYYSIYFSASDLLNFINENIDSEI